MNVFALTVGDRPHGSAVVGVYQTRAAAISDMPNHIESLMKAYGSRVCVLTQQSHDRWETAIGYFAYIQEFELK